MRDGVKLIWDGESVLCNIAWHDTEGAAATPTGVSYQVYDALSEDSVSDVVTVSELDSEMSFVIPAADLPASSAKQRQLMVVIRGEFADGMELPVVGRVTVKRLPEFV